jgi:alpha-beta hydrolase superfamily lysophospholipase
MAERVELQLDVTSALGLGEAAHIAATVILPEVMPQLPVIAFAKPGGSYTRSYYTHDLPGPASGAQADFHADRGWIFVAMDHLGTGESSRHDPQRLDFAHCTRAALAAEQQVLTRLANGGLRPGLPPVLQPVRIGLGQSTGGSMAIVQQALHRCYDGLAVLGFSAVFNQPATAPGEAPVVSPWYSRNAAPGEADTAINAAALSAAQREAAGQSAWASLAWSFHYDDVAAEVVERDLAHYHAIVAKSPAPPDARREPWNAYATPEEAARFVLTPGVVASEAAAITVPVLAAMGERDLVVDPLGEARAYRSAPSFDLFVCPRLGHMHNFGGTRALFWERIHRFGEWCAVHRAMAPKA